MQLFLNSSISDKDVTFIFDKEESKHIVKVLRKKEGDIIYVTNGLGYLFKTEIILASDTKCTQKILSIEKHEASKYELHLAVAPTKMNERFEWFLEKVTEIGVSEITPIICDHSERKIIKVDRFQKIIETAMKQSLQTYLPKLNEPKLYKDFVKMDFYGQKIIAHCIDSERKKLKNILSLNSNVTLMIGPEGDFSDKEIQQALQNNFIAVTLGKTRLRTETAAVVACHTIALLNE